MDILLAVTDGFITLRDATGISGVEAVMRNFKVDLETACKGIDVTVEQYIKAKEVLGK